MTDCVKRQAKPSQGQVNDMPPRDRHGKSAEDYRESLITALDSLSPRPRSKLSTSVFWVWLLIPIAALWLNWRQVSGYLKPAPINISPPALAIRPAIAPAPPPAQQGAPSIADRHDAPAQPQPLSDCMAGGTVVNEAVLRCRFGQVPRPREETELSHGMVSAAYMAKYLAERDARPVSGAGNRQAGTESHWISGWDGTGSYLANWQVVGNEIDSSSVCLDYRRGSIEYRECRKGAKQWFKDECRATRHGDAAHRRYCSAASSFSPMG